jgi:hypothetical protein
MKFILRKKVKPIVTAIIIFMTAIFSVHIVAVMTFRNFFKKVLMV